jgi:hypothetical protein
MILSLLLTLWAPGADFTREVKPILDKHCVGCHGPDKQRASLRTDTARALLEGGSSGPAVTPGKSDQSIIIRAMLGRDEEVKAMPPKGPRVSAAELAVVRAWIDAGAKVPAGETITQARRTSDHWAFQPVKRPQVPNVRESGWARNAIDHFILARLEREGIRPSPEADPITLLRRVTLDLTGLPPTTAEIDAFIRQPDYERAVDRLLASPAYGERWGRIWLDQARYADSNGYSIDAPRAIWKYRDYVIHALNNDMPFDQFTIEQLAGDLLPNATQEQKVATGFHRNTQINEEGGIDREQFRVEAVVDRANTTGTVWLGLTIGCAQCHDHKFDPLSQKEYYQFYAFFNQSDDPKLELVTPENQRRRKAHLAHLAAMEKQLVGLDHLTDDTLARWEGGLSDEARASVPKPIQTILAIAVNGRNARQTQTLKDYVRRTDKVRHAVGALAGPFAAVAHVGQHLQRDRLEREIATAKKTTPPSITTLVLNERRSPRMTAVQIGGDFLRLGAPVKADVPGVLPPLPEGPSRNRLDLARWLVDGQNPLTGRVLVNRIWQHYFGQGLVETENDFGTQGTLPSHPDLLDWLAQEIVHEKWSLKRLHRLIVTSATYRQSSHMREDLRTIDARNLLLARQNRLRLDAELVRDAALAASGLLTRTIGGPSVFPPQPDGVYALTQVPKNWVADTGPNRYRRGLYTHLWRSAPHPGLTTFDAPDGTLTCTRRNRSNTPLQALTLLNDTAFLECATALAEGTTTIEEAFRRCLGRSPSGRELEILTRFLERQRMHLDEKAAWVQLARVLMNLDEFITRE